MRAWVFVLLCSLSPAFSAVVAGEPLVRSGDRVALLGGTLIESLQDRGDCEVAIVLARPELRVPFRNLGWSGDDVYGAARRVFGTPEEGRARLLQDIKTAAPSVAVLAYGFAEASNGPRGVERFEQGLRQLAADLESSNVRRVYALPFALPGVRTDDYGQAMERCREIVRSLAAAEGSPVIDPAAAVAQIGESAFDATGLRLSDEGKAAYGQALAAGLLGIDRETLAGQVDARRVDQVSEWVAAKNALFFHRYRPMNETYLFLFRKHEQGNNAVEVEQFEPLVELAEQRIWDRAADR